MTVPAIDPFSTFVGNGVTTSFPFNYPTFEASWMKVYVGGVQVALGVDYVVTGVGNIPGGSIDFTSPPASGRPVYVSRELPVQRTTDYQNLGDLLAGTLNRDQDEAIMLIQQISGGLDNALVIPPGLVGINRYYDGKGFPIRNISAGLGDTDAATVGQARSLIELVTSGVVGGYGFFQQSGVSPINRTFQDKMREVVSILDFGGASDGTTDNAAAWAKATASVGLNGVVRFPGRHGANYFFASDPNIGTSIIDTDPGVRLSGNVGIYSTIRVTKPVPLDVTAGQNFTHDLTPEFSKDWNGKDLWLTDGDIDRSVVLPINAQTETIPLAVAIATGDTFADAAAQVTFASSSQIQWGTSPADGLVRCSMASVRPGDEINFAFVDTGTYRRAAIIRTSAGYYWVYADGNNAAPHIGGKLVGQASADNTFTYEGRSDHPAYYPENGDWTIRIIDRKRFAVLINGLEVTNIQSAFGDIYQAGPGVTAIGAAKTMNVAGFSRWRSRPHGGKRGQTVLCIGDSLTDPNVHGGWPYAMREALAGSFGVRLLGLYNQAISGDNLSHQLSVLQSNGTQGASVAVIALGTNDAQFSSNTTGYIADLTTMLTALRSNFCEPIIWIHQAWYEKAQSGGGGQATVNSGSGAYLRALILRFCADNNVKCVDMRNVSGAVTAAWLLTGKGTKTNTVPISIDPWVRDNIHPTTHAYRVMGFHIARAVAGLINPAYTRSQPLTVLPSTLGQNGWTTTTQSLQYVMTADGIVKLNGILNSGTITSATIMFTLPRHLWPLATTRTPCVTNVANGYAVIQIGVDGNVTLYNAPAGTTYVDLSPVSYQTAG